MVRYPQENHSVPTEPSVTPGSMLASQDAWKDEVPKAHACDDALGLARANAVASWALRVASFSGRESLHASIVEVAKVSVLHSLEVFHSLP